MNLTDGGYLDDLDTEWGQLSNPDVVSFEAIAAFPCLGLLGEPGMGKTRTMLAQREVIDRKVEEEGGQTLWLDLRSYGSEDRLIRNLFENQVLLSWVNGSHRLHIFLDSLDECLLRIDTLAFLLVEEFQKYSALLGRLYLRIACRTADWPNTLEEGLPTLWGEDAVGVYELAPLRRVDIATAARANGLDADAFLQEIDHKSVVPLAIKPVILDFLLNIYRKHGQFPSTQTELYSQGCQLLCEESSASRRDARLTGTLTAAQRMAVAARIAAVTVFANRYAVWTGLALGDVPDEDVTVQELRGGRETVDGNTFEINDAIIKETLDTGLFSSRGPHRMGWAHQSYAEFLAAHYLTQHHMTPAPMMALLVHPNDPERKLIPQLHETAAWLAGMAPAIFRDVMQTDPDVLLRSDVAVADVKDRVALVESLLRLYDNERALDRDWDRRKRYSKLAHPELADQLRSYICAVTKGLIARRVAIDIAEACELQTLQGELADIALDPSQTLLIRTEAAAAVSRIGDAATKARLKPLAIGAIGDDPDDELKGWSLRAVWSEYITAEELLSVLTPPKREHFIGTYRIFISKEIAPHLQPSDLPVALEWIVRQPPRQGYRRPFGMIIDEITLKSIQHLEVPGVLKSLVKAILSRLKHHDESNEEDYRGTLAHDDGKRRQILQAVLPILSDPDRDWRWPILSRLPLVVSRDIPWMIERFKLTKSRKIKQILVRLIQRLYDLREPVHLELVFTASHESPMLAEAFEWLLKPVALDSVEAQRMKADYLEELKWQKLDPERTLLQPSPAERIAARLDACESGNSAAWWSLNMEMTLEPHSTHYDDELEPDLTVLPGWKAAEPVTRARIVEAAMKYLQEQGPNTQEWLGKNIVYLPAFAGYRALQLLLCEDPQFVSTLPAKVWKEWAPIILDYLIPTNSDSATLQQRLIKMAYEAAPEEIIDTLMVLIDKDNRESGHTHVTSKLEACWDSRLAEALLTKANDRTLKPECMGDLLAELLNHGVSEARVFAESLIPLPPPATCHRRARAIIAASVLIAHANDAGWPHLWLAMQQDTAFGREVMIEFAKRSDEYTPSLGQKLSEEQIADVYLWLARQYPHAEDPHHERAHPVGPRECVANLRDALLRHLEELGTPGSCAAIQRIMRELPELDWLKWVLQDAQQITRRRTWVPPRPGEILKVASDHELRLVQSGDQLLEVLIESLRRLEAKLQGETPAAQFLWDKVVKKNAWRPKDENALSDYVKIHLDEDLKQRGIIVNREVEIRRGHHPGQGERTDIHVDAVVRGPDREVYDSLTAIVEVKGCWNKDLDQAMKTQLVDRYLKDNPCQHGLYLVGWFNCNQWDDSDYRKGQSLKLSIHMSQQQFDIQAIELSQQDLRIKALVLNTALR